MKYFVRYGTHPKSDLRRNVSYVWGMFRDEEGAHEGLSGYEVEGIEHVGTVEAVLGALCKLHDYWHARWGGRRRRCRDAHYLEEEAAFVFEATFPQKIALYSGRYRAHGPDGEDIFSADELLDVYPLKREITTGKLAGRFARIIDTHRNTTP